MTPSPKINSQVIFKASEMVTKSWTSCHNVSFMIFIIILPLLFHNYEKARNGVYHVKSFWQANSLFHTVFKQLYLKKNLPKLTTPSCYFIRKWNKCQALWFWHPMTAIQNLIVFFPRSTYYSKYLLKKLNRRSRVFYITWSNLSILL